MFSFYLIILLDICRFVGTHVEAPEDVIVDLGGDLLLLHDLLDGLDGGPVGLVVGLDLLPHLPLLVRILTRLVQNIIKYFRFFFFFFFLFSLFISKWLCLSVL